MTRWTNGFLVRFTGIWQGLDVWGDDLHVDILGDSIVEVSGLIHSPDTTARMQEPLPVRPQADALATARISLAASQTTWAPHDIHLAYAAGELMGAPHSDGLDFVLVWRVEFHAPEDGLDHAPTARVFWVNATTGKVISSQP